jgi:DNA-binding CsgD family transcriptional regulator/predicted ATPase
MIGRERERAELVRAWSAVGRSRSTRRTVVITGAAGVGKSLLVSSALGELTPEPGAVLSGTARLHAPAPYDWLAAVLSGRDTDKLSVPPDALAWLAQHPDAPRERYAPGALLRLAVQTVRELVATGAGVLVVEDLHALDPASLSLVAELATAPDLPVLMIVTSRPPDTGVSPQLAARTLARVSGAPGSVRQHLGPLTVAQVAGLLADTYPDAALPSRLVRVIRERTGGNPYWLTELVAAAGDPAELATMPVPEHLRLVADPTLDIPEPARDRGPSWSSRFNGLGVSHVDNPAVRLDGADQEPELTAREREVLSCLAEGMSNKQVAQSLGISIRTVTVHVSNLLRKTRSASRTEAALWALQRR